ncbi:hypothetical protein MASR2M117_13760 [Paludibacter sp.]
MRHTQLFFKSMAFIALFISFSSCKRAINVDEINAMSVGAQKDSASLYYNTGLQKGDMLIAVDTFYLNTQAKSEYKGKKEVRPGDDFEWAVDEYRGARIFTGDTLMVVGGYRHEVFENVKKAMHAKYRSFVQVERIENGKQTAKGWTVGQHDLCRLVQPDAPVWWSYFFHVSSSDFMVNLIVLSLFVVLIALVWRLIYWLIIRFIVKSAVFWKQASIISQSLFLILSAALAVLVFFIRIDDPLIISLRFNPDFFAHWAEYPLFIKILPFVLGFWILSAIAMAWEMAVKFKSWWLLIYYPGKLALGCLIVGLVILAGWLIYIILPGIIALVVIMMMGKTDEMTGGALSGSGSSSKSTPTITFRDDAGVEHVSGVDRDSANKRIAERKEGGM